MSTNYPKRIFTSFMKNKNTSNSLKNSKYINNYPSTTLLSLKRFFGKENQDKLFKSFKSPNKNQELNERYIKTKDTLNTIDSNNNKMLHKSISMVNPLKYKSNISQLKNKENNDLYLSKEYNYELELDDTPNKIMKKNVLGKNHRKIHFIKYSCEDPQQQLIFARMNDIRNLEVLTNNNNNKSLNMNDIANDKIQESKFYEMYDKFKQKYLYNSSKIYSGKVKNYNRINKYKQKDNNTISSQSYTSNKNINIINGMKFIRNNSDFFYGVKTSKNGNQEIKENQKLPYINNNKSNQKYSIE